ARSDTAIGVNLFPLGRFQDGPMPETTTNEPFRSGISAFVCLFGDRKPAGARNSGPFDVSWGNRSTLVGARISRPPIIASGTITMGAHAG
ncbi:MAG: hypothetical protein OXC91_07910, partial [Rhodobacteraceae bacterium]|nr:hypothetical protein [Paracoccaceae bacterium]